MANIQNVSLVDRGRVVSGGGSGSGGHTIINEAGTSLAQEPNLQFKGADISDDSTNNRTVVDMSYTEIDYEDWLELTEQEKETGRWDVVGVPGADGTVSFDLMTKLWENPNPTVAFASQTITLSSSDYDLLLTIARYKNNNTRVVSSVIGLNGYLNFADVASSSAANYYRGFNASGNNVTFTNTGGSSTTDNTILIPYQIYGIKLHKTVEIKAIAPEVSTSASKCMMSDGETSVEDALSYSTDEHVIGTWIDGKTLYEKTFSVKNPSTGSVTIAPLVGEVVDIQGIFRRTDGAVIPSPYYDTSTYRLFYSINVNNVLSMYIAGYNISEAIVTVQYIKN